MHVHRNKKRPRQQQGYLSDVLVRVVPPQLIILIIEAHEGQHALGQQVVGVLLHVLPCGGKSQGV